MFPIEDNRLFFSETPRFPGKTQRWGGLGEWREGKEYRGLGHKFTEANGSAFFSLLIFIILELFFFAFEVVVLRAIN